MIAKVKVGNEDNVCAARNRRLAHLFRSSSTLYFLRWWRRCGRPLRLLHIAQQSIAQLLFDLRILPLLASLVATFAFVVPSFQRLEPRSTNLGEAVGVIPLICGACALLLIAYGSFRGVAAQTRTTRVVTQWLEGARSLPADGESTVAFQSRREVPPLTLVGLRNSTVLVSESAFALLTRNELHIALKHELEHLKARDNLKKLIFRVCPFPGMTKLENAWSQAAELAADDAAVSSPSDALDLAAALVKLSRLVPVKDAPVCSVGLVTGFLSERVARLLSWDEASKARRVRVRTWFVLPPVIAASLLASIAYAPMLAFTHKLTEWLVR